MSERSRQTYSRAEKRAYYIGIGAGGSDERTAREYVRKRCGSDAGVMASFERGIRAGRIEKPSAAPAAKSFDTSDFYAAALRKTYGNQ